MDRTNDLRYCSCPVGWRISNRAGASLAWRCSVARSRNVSSVFPSISVSLSAQQSTLRNCHALSPLLVLSDISNTVRLSPAPYGFLTPCLTQMLHRLAQVVRRGACYSEMNPPRAHPNRALDIRLTRRGPSPSLTMPLDSSFCQDTEMELLVDIGIVVVPCVKSSRTHYWTASTAKTTRQARGLDDVLAVIYFLFTLESSLNTLVSNGKCSVYYRNFSAFTEPS